MKDFKLSNRLNNAIKSVIDYKEFKRPVALHEPFFKNTNALKYVQDCLDSGWVSSSGSWVNAFEDKICEVTGSPYTVSVTNGTVALRLALYALGVKAGEEVIIPPLSFVATANSVSHLGAVPHFVDIEKSSLGLCPKSLEKRLDEIALKKNGSTWNRQSGRRIAAIIPVHVFGIPADVQSIKKISNKWDIPVIEDAAEALGSFINLKNEHIHCGLIGEIGTLSFNGNKIITTGGGGALLIKDKLLAERVRHLSTTCKIPHPWEYNHNEVGWNDRLPNLNAALGVSQLEDFESRIYKKKLLSQKYKNVFKNIDDIEFIENNTKNIFNHWLLTIRFLDFDISNVKKNRDKLLQLAYDDGIFLRPCWRPLHLLPMYKDAPKGDLQVIKDQEFRLINLPSSPQILD